MAVGQSVVGGVVLNPLYLFYVLVLLTHRLVHLRRCGWASGRVQRIAAGLLSSQLRSQGRVTGLQPSPRLGRLIRSQRLDSCLWVGVASTGLWQAVWLRCAMAGPWVLLQALLQGTQARPLPFCGAPKA